MTIDAYRRKIEIALQAEVSAPACSQQLAGVFDH